MLQHTFKWTRPTTDVPFFDVRVGDDPESVSFRQHWVSTYREPGKLLLVDKQYSPDQLTLTTTFFWDSEESFNTASADPIAINKWKLREAYNEQRGIVKISETVTNI